MFCGYVFYWYLQIGYRIPALGVIRFEFIYAAVLTVLALFFTPKIDMRCPLLPYVVLYFLVILVQVPLSQDPNMSWNIFVDRILKFSFMAFFIVSFVRSPIQMKYFIATFLLACLKMGVEGYLGRVSGALIWENQGIMRLHGSTPLYSHPNSFAGMALGTLPFVYFLWPFCNRYLKAVLLVIAALSLHIVLYTGSRTGYVGVMAFLVYVFYISKQKKKFIGYILLALALTIPMIPTDYRDRFSSIFTQKEKEGKSADARIEILKDAWQIFQENPLGVGVAAFPKVRMERFGRIQDTHNLYLEIATNLGIQGIVIVSLLIMKLISILKIIKTETDKLILMLRESDTITNNKLISDLTFIGAMSLATTSFIVIRLALGLFGMDLYEIYWWFAIGITFSLYSMKNTLRSFIVNDERVNY